MIRQSTIDKLHEMRLSAMSDAFESQCADLTCLVDFHDLTGLPMDMKLGFLGCKMGDGHKIVLAVALLVNYSV